MVTSSVQADDPYDRSRRASSEEDEISHLTAADLASILKWSKDISSDINLLLALQRLTEIATESSGSQLTCVVIAREVGDYTVATSMVPPEPCQVHEYGEYLLSNTPFSPCLIIGIQFLFVR